MAHKGNYALTPGGELKKPSTIMLREWILTAWERISSQSIVAAFKMNFISNALDDTKNDFPWQDAEDENDESECEEEEDDEQSEN